VPGSANNVAIDLLVTHINKQLDTRSLRFRNMLSKIGEKEERLEADHNDNGPGVVLLQQTNQLLVSQLIETSLKKLTGRAS
jgi:uridine kinase